MKKIFLYIICFISLNKSLAQGLRLTALKPLDTLHLQSYSSQTFHKKSSPALNQSLKPLVFKSPYNHINEIGFFCRWELKMDKQVSHPVRFRLGSLDYTNRMEGK